MQHYLNNTLFVKILKAFLVFFYFLFLCILLIDEHFSAVYNKRVFIMHIEEKMYEF